MGIDTHEVLEAASTKFKKVLLNESFVIQNYHSGANKKLRLLFIFISSYFKYFNKWGWFNFKSNTLNN